jgi:hypothetical protein
MSFQSDLPLQELAPSSRVRRFVLPDGLVLLNKSSNTLFAFNQVARYVWELVEEKHTEKEIGDSLASTWRIPVDRARRDIRSIVGLWRKQGLLAGTADSPPPEAGSTTLPIVIPSEGQSQWTCTIRGVPIAFSVPTDLATGLRALFRLFRTPDAVPQSTMTISKQPSGKLAFVEDGRQRLCTGEWEVAAGALFVAVLERIRSGVEWLALMHGAALSRRGHGFALAGPSGAGKSTLTAGLIGAGFDYLADDCVALSSPGAKIVPWPLPLSVKPGGLDILLTDFPQLKDAPRYQTKGVESRLLIPPRDAWDAEPVPLKTILFPSFQQGAAPEHRKLSSFEVLEKLLKDRVWLGDPITEDRLGPFLQWLNETPSYALTYGGQADAICMVECLIP